MTDTMAATARTARIDGPGDDTPADVAAHPASQPADDAALSSDVAAVVGTIDGADVATTPLGCLDGPDGELRGDRFDPRDAGLPADATMQQIVDRLLFDPRPLTVRQQRRLRRHALVSCLVTASRHELLRAAARWAQAVTTVAADLPDDDALRRHVDREVDYARQAFFELGGGQLAGREASRWNRPGALTELADLAQDGYEQALAMLHRYDPNRGAPFSSFAYYAINEAVASEVHKTEHPHLPRAAFKKRGEVRRLAEQLEAAGADLHDPDVQQHIADRVGITLNGVTKIINPTRTVPLNAHPHGDDDGVEYADLLADPNPQPQETSLHAETIQNIADAMATHLDGEEIDIILRSEGLAGDGDRENLSAIAADYGKSRTWAGIRRRNGYAKLQHAVPLAQTDHAEIG